MKEEKLFNAFKRINETGYYWTVVKDTDTYTALEIGSATPLPGKWLIVWVVDYPDEVLAELADHTESHLRNNFMAYIYCIKWE